MKILWRSDGYSNGVGCELRLMDIDGDKVFEVAIPYHGSVFKRIITAIKYILGLAEIRTEMVISDEKFYKMCRSVVDDSKDGKG